MKKITKILLGLGMLFSTTLQAQCLDAVEGQYPSATSTATTCDGLTVTTITTVAWASEYSLVNVTAGETYTFRSSVATDFITISSDDGATAAAYGVTPVIWVADVTGPVRFYTHLDDQCGAAQVSRTRSYICGVPPCIPSSVTFATVRDCDNSTFNVTADISSLGSAGSLTVSDDQGSASQSVSTTGLVTFGPYSFGTSVVLTVTNDDNSICTVSSTPQVIYACPMPNDDCANAVTMVCGDTLTAQTTEGATGGTSTSCVGTIGNDVWYTFVGDGQIYTLTASATNTEGPQVEVYASTDGTCSGFTAGTCLAAAGSGGLVVPVSFSTVNGTVYYAHVGSWINGDPATVFDLSLTCAAPPTAPDNDECTGAYAVTVNPDLSCGSVTSGTLVGATQSAVDAAACGGTEDDDVWFSFVATDTRHQINLTNVVGSTTDLYHSLWTGDCTGLTLVPGTCSDPNTSNPSGLTIGQTYYIRVYSFTATPLQTTTFDVCVGTLPPPPANDDCSNAIPVTVSNSFASGAIVGTNASASSTTGLTFNCQTNRKSDVWYSFVVPASGSVIVETDTNPGTAMTDSVVSVFRGSCGALTEVGCDDDTGNGNFSKVTIASGLTPGETLYVGVWTYGTGGEGEFQLSVYDPTMATNVFDSANFSYAPNPVSDVLKFTSSKNITAVAVYNLLGQEVWSQTNNNLTQVDMSHLVRGTYLVKVTADNQVKTIKVSKK